ncbi:MAG: E3 binding domain-containing protein [Deinococcales bacterium]
MTESNISPLARRLAEENNVNWRKLIGSGPSGKVIEKDIIEYLHRVMSGDEPPNPTPEPLPKGMSDWPEENLAGILTSESPQQLGSEMDMSWEEDDLLLVDESDPLQSVVERSESQDLDLKDKAYSEDDDLSLLLEGNQFNPSFQGDEDLEVILADDEAEDNIEGFLNKRSSRGLDEEPDLASFDDEVALENVDGKASHWADLSLEDDKPRVNLSTESPSNPKAKTLDFDSDAFLLDDELDDDLDFIPRGQAGEMPANSALLAEGLGIEDIDIDVTKEIKHPANQDVLRNLDTIVLEGQEVADDLSSSIFDLDLAEPSSEFSAAGAEAMNFGLRNHNLKAGSFQQADIDDEGLLLLDDDFDDDDFDLEESLQPQQVMPQLAKEPEASHLDDDLAWLQEDNLQEANWEEDNLQGEGLQEDARVDFAQDGISLDFELEPSPNTTFANSELKLADDILADLESDVAFELSETGLVTEHNLFEEDLLEHDLLEQDLFENNAPENDLLAEDLLDLSGLESSLDGFSNKQGDRGEFLGDEALEEMEDGGVLELETLLDEAEVAELKDSQDGVNIFTTSTITPETYIRPQDAAALFEGEEDLLDEDHGNLQDALKHLKQHTSSLPAASKLSFLDEDVFADESLEKDTDTLSLQKAKALGLDSDFDQALEEADERLVHDFGNLDAEKSFKSTSKTSSEDRDGTALWNEVDDATGIKASPEESLLEDFFNRQLDLDTDLKEESEGELADESVRGFEQLLRLRNTKTSTLKTKTPFLGMGSSLKRASI